MVAVEGEGIGGELRSLGRSLQLGAAFAANDLAGRAAEVYENREALVDRATGVLAQGRELVEGAQGFIDDTVAPIADAAAPILDHPLVEGGLGIAGGAVVAAVDARNEGVPLRGKVVRAVGAGIVRTALGGILDEQATES